MKKIGTILGLFFVTLVALASSNSDNIHRQGDLNPATDKEFQMGDGVIKWDGSSTKLQISNDAGSNYKEIGTGSGTGSGINLLTSDENPDFESGTPPSSWTASGGTFAGETSNPGFGAQSGSMDFSAAAQTLSSSLVAVVQGLENRNCSSRIQIKNDLGSSGDVKFQVVDSGNTVLAEKDIDVMADWRSESLGFTCPASDSIRVRILAVAADPNIFLIDNVELGQSNDIQLSQAEVYGKAIWTPAPSCIWPGDGAAVGASYEDFILDSDCNNPTVSGKALAPATKIPAIKFDNLPAGKYEIQVRGSFQLASGASTECLFSVTDGTTIAPTQQSFDPTGSTASRQAQIGASFEYASEQSSVEFRPVSYQLAGVGVCGIANSTIDQHGFEIVVKKYPTSAADAITMETTGEYWSGEITGTNFSTSSDFTAYETITGSDWVLTNDSGAGSAKIACDGAAADGTTCSGSDESLGFVIDISSAGQYKVCSNVNVFFNAGGTTGGNVNKVTLGLFATNADGTVVNDESTEKAQISSSAETANDGDGGSSQKICHIFNFSSAGEKRIETRFVSDIVNGSVQFSVDAGSGNDGGRNFSFEVFKLSQQFPTPVFTDLTNSLAKKNETDPANSETMRVLSAAIDFSVSPSIIRQDGNWIDSLTDNGAGDLTLNFTVGTFSSTPNCFPVPLVASGREATVATPSSTAVTIRMWNSGGTPTDTDFNVLCIGPK